MKDSLYPLKKQLHDVALNATTNQKKLSESLYMKLRLRNIPSM